MSNLDNTVFTPPKVKVDTSIKLEVFRVTVRKLRIFWTELPHKYFKEPNSVAYLEVSDAPNDGWELVCEITKFQPPYALDESTKLTYYRSMVAYYRIRFEDGTTTLPFSTDKLPNYYGAEISRRHAIALKEGHQGNLFYLFIRKKFMDPCPECWDSIRGTRSKSYCKTCLGVGFVGGYYNPIGIYMSVTPEETTIQQEVDGVSIPGNMSGWTSGFPRISLGDVLVDPATQDIWHVQSLRLTTHKRTVTKQEVQLVHQDEDVAIMQLLQRIPRTPQGKDVRHGEILF